MNRQKLISEPTHKLQLIIVIGRPTLVGVAVMTPLHNQVHKLQWDLCNVLAPTSIDAKLNISSPTKRCVNKSSKSTVDVAHC